METVYNIQEYGAVGDGVTLNTHAIQAAIDACAENGGGKVIIPAGQFLTGTLHLRDHVELHITPAATLVGSQKRSDYPDIACVSVARYGERPSPSEDGRYLGHALLFAQNAKNVSITGTGLIFGNVTNSEFDTKQNPKLHEWHRPVPIWCDECEDIRLMDIHIRRSAMWSVVFSACTDIMVTSSITGFPGHYVEGVTLKNITVTIRNTPAILDPEEIPHDLPENEQGYPKSIMFGYILPATGLWIRHAKNITLQNVNIEVLNPDIRPTYLFDDVQELNMDVINLPRALQEPQVVLQDVQHATLRIRKKSMVQVLETCSEIVVNEK